MRRSVLAYAAPLLLALAGIALPLARGTETLFLRDVLNSHLNMKWAQAEAMREGYMPLVDVYRAGGQPLAGNMNAVPFYPDNLLYLAASPIWALNAHFWIHLLLAPFAFYWLARAWGLAREPAWAAAALYTLSGFFLSHLSFYNLIAGAALAPALAAACLTADREGRRRWMPVAVALLWALLLLGGDPLMAALAFLLAASAILLRPARPRLRTLALLAGAFAAGTLLAAPQLVEFLRILPLSFRGHWGYTAEVATTASWDPRQAAEWLLPFLFGRPDRIGAGSFWGHRFFTDVPPYYLSLYPGLLALALLAASGRPRSRAAIWAWGALGFGLFFSLGRFNPLVAWVFELGRGSFRYPVKFWLPVAVGGALLGGIGFGRLLAPPTGERHPRAFAATLMALALVLGAAWVFLSFFPDAAAPVLKGLIGKRTPAFVANERLRLAGLCLFSLLALALLAALAPLLRRRPRLGGALLLAAHAGLQIFFLRPLFPTDAAFPYGVPPRALAHVPPGSRVVHGSFLHLFNISTIDSGSFPEPKTLWMERRAFAELYPFTGPLHHRRYELNVSPEGLDSFLTRMAQGAVKAAKDPARLRLLASWGVDRLLLDRPLAKGAPGARLLARLPSFGRTLYIYELERRSPDFFLATRVVRAPNMNAAYRALLEPRFDSRSEAVLPGGGPPVPAKGGTVRVLRDRPEDLEAEVDARGPGVLVIQRANLPLYRATVDGREAPIEIANIHRMAVRVPAGRHRVRLATDRRPLHLSLLATLAGLLALPALAWAGGRRQEDPPPAGGAL